METIQRLGCMLPGNKQATTRLVFFSSKGYSIAADKLFPWPAAGEGLCSSFADKELQRTAIVLKGRSSIFQATGKNINFFT